MLKLALLQRRWYSSAQLLQLRAAVGAACARLSACAMLQGAWAQSECASTPIERGDYPVTESFDGRQCQFHLA